MMLTEFRPYASGTFIPMDYFAKNPSLNTTQFEYNSWKALNNYNFCRNCSDFEPEFINMTAVNSTGPFNVYKHYWDSIFYLLGIFIFFRVMTIVSLMIQDMQTERAGDTRN